MVRVVICLTLRDVVGEGNRHHGLVVPVPIDQIDDVVAHHAAEPPELLALVIQVVPHVGGRNDTDLDVVRLPAGLHRCVVDRLHRPLEDLGIRQLEDEAVRVPAHRCERPRAVARSPHRQVPALVDPRDLDLEPVVDHGLARNEAFDDRHGLDHVRKGPGFEADVPERGVPTPHAADRPFTEHLVERGEQGRQDGGIPCPGIRDHRADDHALGVREDLAEDDERFLPQHVAVERPCVCEAVALCRHGELDHLLRRWVRLEYDAEVHQIRY